MEERLKIRVGETAGIPWDKNVNFSPKKKFFPLPSPLKKMH
jgi:hypothetical protein